MIVYTCTEEDIVGESFWAPANCSMEEKPDSTLQTEKKLYWDNIIDSEAI